jgi:hypothetical protein
MPQLLQKMMLSSKVDKSGSKIILPICDTLCIFKVLLFYCKMQWL